MSQTQNGLTMILSDLVGQSAPRPYACAGSCAALSLPFHLFVSS